MRITHVFLHYLHKLHALTTFASSLLFVVSMFSMPFLGSAPPDPFYVLKVMPWEYWLGFALVITGLLMGVILHERGCKTFLTAVSLFLLTGYVYVLPKLLFSNPIWTDTYSFVGETLYALRYGYVGFGHAVETPILSIFAAQFSLLLDVDHLIIAEVIPLILPFYAVAVVYFFASLFRRGGIPYLASMAYLGFMWFGFYFNRQSFALLLQFLAWYLVMKRFTCQEVGWSASALLVFSAVVGSHPASSLSVVLSMVALVALMLLFKVGLLRASNQSQWLRGAITRAAVITATTLLTVWLSWNIYHFGSFGSAIMQTFIALNELSSAPDPTTHVVAITRGYPGGYQLIVNLRLFILVFNIVVGTVLSVLACMATKLRKEFVILAAIFFTTATMVAYTTYAYRWADKGFLYTLFPAVILVSWFVLDFKASGLLTTKVVKVLKIFMVVVVVVFTALTPLLMYSHMAFVYPPRADLAMLEFQARHGRGSLLVIGGHTDLVYMMFAEEASLKWKGVPVPEPKELMAGRFTGYNLIATTFRAYTKDAFVKFDPSLTSAMVVFECELNNEYARVYEADGWHKVYWAP